MKQRSALSRSPGAAGPLLDEEGPGPAWQDAASCATADPEAWFPEPGGHDGEMAKAVCRSCPVKRECLEYAMARNEQWGVWGGLSELERRTLKRQRRKLERRQARETLTEAA
jgi:WhiB family redox-sensing transcriptional regulator